MKTLVIGVGNEYRGDDAAGLLVARRVRELNLPPVEIVESGGEFMKLMECWREAKSVILIDAVQSGAAPGTIHRFNANKQKLPASLFQCSTHAFGIAEAIEMTIIFGQMPRHFLVFGIEGENFAMGMTLSTAVESALEPTVKRVLREIEPLGDELTT